MSAEVDPLFRDVGPLTPREAEFLAGIRLLSAELRGALLAAMQRRVAGEPWHKAVPAGFRDAGWSEEAAAPEVALMLAALDPKPGR